jgi:ABC-type thiamine transport system ATPase subunit
VADEYDPPDGLSRVLLGTDTETRAPVYLSHADRPLGVAIVGKSGTGKSSLLEHMILSDLANGIPGMVIDPHGLLAERVMQSATRSRPIASSSLKHYVTRRLG